MKTWSCASPDPETTREIAAELGRSIGDEGLVIGLRGPLGAGKTVFVKGLAAGLGIDPRLVSSPTFVLAQQLPIPGDDGAPAARLHHVDLYRLESELELESIGFYDFFEAGAVIAVEWADRFPDALGAEWLELELLRPSERAAGADEAPNASPTRLLRARAHGVGAERVLDDWAGRVDRAERLRGEGGLEGATAGPQRRAGWLLGLAFLLWAGVRLGTLEPGPQPPCGTPRSVAIDDWGTSRVVCLADTNAAGSLRGVGGLLFGAPLPLETATARELEALPGIGPSRARAILAARARLPFESLEDLERASGIGPKLRMRLARWVSVGARGDRGTAPSSDAEAGEPTRNQDGAIGRPDGAIGRHAAARGRPHG